MRLTLPRLLALVLPFVLLAGCKTNPAAECGGDIEYLQAVERPPLVLPPDIEPTERMQAMAIPPVDPNPTRLDPEPACLDQPPKFFARKGAVADSAEDAVRAWDAAWASRKADAVIDAYSKSFQPPGDLTAAAFLEQRRKQVETGPTPEPKLEDVQVTTVGAEKRVVTFVQRFGEGAVRKELTMVREGAAWRIVSERTLEVL